jgi:hypothetical protein
MVPTHRLEVYDVVNPDGQHLGEVRDFMLDMKAGRMAFAVVTFGGFLGFGDKWFVLPWEILDWSPEKKRFILNMPREVLEKAPGLDKRKWPNEVDLSWLSACYLHYGCAPYWEAPMVTEEHVKKLAFALWEIEGKPEGKEVENYYQAERILREQEFHRQPPHEFVSVLGTASPGHPAANPRQKG